MNVSTVLSPALFHLYSEGLSLKNVVVIDILRATTSMVVAHKNGAMEVLPVKSPEQALALREQGYLIAGERNGITLEGFDFGNSPQEFSPERVNGKRIAITTTNGTQAVDASKGARNIYISAFINLSATANALINDNHDVLLFCSGWKDNFNLEDTLFAGALAQMLIDLSPATVNVSDDATRMALSLWQLGKENPADFLKDASHVQRFKSLHVESDLDAALKFDDFDRALRLG